MTLARTLRSVALPLTLGAVVSTPAAAKSVALEIALARPVLEAERRHTTYLKVSLSGFLPESGQRAPANVAIVLDRSGSMQGEKLRRAKEAAIAAIDRLSAGDIVAVVAYDDTVGVLVPATRVSDRDAIRRAIMELSAGSSTALFAGVSKGASEVRKFLGPNRVNRVILLSDGLANVGPDTPAELGELGLALKKEGIAATTVGLGLGYHEDLMSRLAERSDGNHAFVEHPRDLARIFDRELGDVLSVVAQDVEVQIDCPPGVRPVRVLGREAEIYGSTVVVTVNQLYGAQEKYVLVELDVDPGRAGGERRMANVSVSYADTLDQSTNTLSGRATAGFTDSAALAASRENHEVMVAVVEQIATEKNELAVLLRDEGKIEEAKEVLLENARYVATQATAYGSEKLEAQAESNREDADNLDAEEWNRQRKQMRELQVKRKSQRDW